MDFVSIEQHGFIGNLGSCALVRTDGTIDWCCLPRLDSPSVFASMLDAERGGFFSIHPAGATTTRQEYVDLTAILRTTFTTETGVVELTDWMHMGGFSSEEEEHHTFPALYRFVRCTKGTVEMTVCFNPRLNYGRDATALEAAPDGSIVVAGASDQLRLHTSLPLAPSPQGMTGHARLRSGQSLTFICTYGSVERSDVPPAMRSYERTCEYWQRWIATGRDRCCHLLPAWQQIVDRSCVTLKILAGGKGIAAAATTSLPEIIGGSHNWDYRFNWIRDTSFTVQALCSIGHFFDAREFLDWLTELLLTGGRRPADLQVLYPLHAASLMPEQELSHLRGCADSRPVRIGNAASTQRQADIYGEVLRTVFLAEELQPKVDQSLSGVLRDIVEYVCEIWKEPDHGIWEMRTPPRQYTYSKVMCWVAIDHGIRLAETHGWQVDLDHWRQERDAVRTTVLEQGWNPRLDAFTQSFGSDELDATALLFPLLGFLPPDDPKALSTLDVLLRELSDGPFVYRSSAHRREEGAFGLCSFWMVEALLAAGRSDQAREHFEELIRSANHLGLFAEEIDPKSKSFLGNFPQAFTHVGLINSAVALSRAFATA
ncbi:MAG: glycoside hydrolase family 15 protein [Candidatus Peribacteraceae bacterium]|jgi:GH15 family glucan-1,4-alpha-glucosidase|nr:glycoside hydrolase family 15 protein [Candidatus Peribacteraceae bacterium]